MSSDSDKDSENSNKKSKNKKDSQNERDEKFEFLRVVKEKQNFPCKFNNSINLKQIITYYDKNWGDGMSDDDEENDGMMIVINVKNK